TTTRRLIEVTKHSQKMMNLEKTSLGKSKTQWIVSSNQSTHQFICHSLERCLTGEKSKKRREILSRRPSYRKILNELSSPVPIKTIDEESNSSQSQDGESQEAAQNLTGHTSLHYQTAGNYVLSISGLQLQGQEATQGLQTLTMTNVNPTTATPTSAPGATIVQYAQGPDGQFYIPVSVGTNTGTVQAYQLATSGTLPQGVVMATTGSAIASPQQLGEEASRKRELRLLKNREAAKECRRKKKETYTINQPRGAAKECRRKKKEYVKCLENRVAVLENQNKTLIDELKSLKELYCENNS
ncbi:hypothetical protein ScPMuIL_016375, partial [Solemya velum]